MGTELYTMFNTMVSSTVSVLQGKNNQGQL